jgi:hypothetical protein
MWDARGNPCTELQNPFKVFSTCKTPSNNLATSGNERGLGHGPQDAVFNLTSLLNMGQPCLPDVTLRANVTTSFEAKKGCLVLP